MFSINIAGFYRKRNKTSWTYSKSVDARSNTMWGGPLLLLYRLLSFLKHNHDVLQVRGHQHLKQWRVVQKNYAGLPSVRWTQPTKFISTTMFIFKRWLLHGLTATTLNVSIKMHNYINDGQTFTFRDIGQNIIVFNNLDDWIYKEKSLEDSTI